MNKHNTVFLENVKKLIALLSLADQGKIRAAAAVMESGDFTSVYIKTLKTPIKELIIKRHRLIFFIAGNAIYFVGIFIKKSTKTPKKEIEKAEIIYRAILAIKNKK